MTETAPAANQAGNPATPITSAERVALNRQLAQMLKGGVIMDVTTPEQARIAEAEKLGFQHIIIPKYNLQGFDHSKYTIAIHPVRKVEEALRLLFG